MNETFHPHPIVTAIKIFIAAAILTGAIIFASVFLGPATYIAAAVLWLLALLKIGFEFLAARYHVITLEEHSVSYRIGVISQRSIALPYQKITEASYHQDILQRLFGVGTLRLDTAGGTHMAIHLVDMKWPEIQKILDRVKEKSGQEISDD